MKKTPITKRLKHIANLIPTHYNVADIGTDHGYLPSFLLEQNISRRVIMSDVNLGPLDNAKMTFAQYHSNALDKAFFRLGSGIETLTPNETDCIVIAGMGGGLIRMILEKDIEKSLSFKTWFLQPQTEQPELRDYILNTLKQPIVAEAFVEENGKLYEILVVGEYELKESSLFDAHSLTNDLEFGTKILTSDIDAYIEFIEFKKRKYKIILDRLPETDEHFEKVHLCKEKIQKIDTLLEALNVHKCGEN